MTSSFRFRHVGLLPVRVGRECGDGEPGEFSPAAGGSRHSEEQHSPQPTPGGQHSHQGQGEGEGEGAAPQPEQEQQETEDSEPEHSPLAPLEDGGLF